MTRGRSALRDAGPDAVPGLPDAGLLGPDPGAPVVGDADAGHDDGTGARLRVTLIRKARVPYDEVTEDIDWPANWPIPSQGSIVTGKVVGGWVEHVEFDVPSRRTLVVLR